jgi:hypothetical protein
MAKVLRSGHGTGDLSPLLAGISDAAARQLISKVKPMKGPVEGSGLIGTKTPKKKIVLRVKSKSGQLEDYVVRSKRLKVG